VTLLAELIPVARYRVGDLRRQYPAMPTSGEAVVSDGWLAANGALVLISKYPKLFTEIGHAYNPAGPGVDPGGGQFYLPDCTDGRQPIPKGATNFPTRGARAGFKTIALPGDGSQDVFHQHAYLDLFGPQSGSGSFSQRTVQGDHGADRTDTTTIPVGHPGGAAAAHQNMPPILVTGGWKIRYK
jgi:microcystin-dependent protein